MSAEVDGRADGPCESKLEVAEHMRRLNCGNVCVNDAGRCTDHYSSLLPSCMDSRLALTHCDECPLDYVL